VALCFLSFHSVQVTRSTRLSKPLRKPFVILYLLLSHQSSRAISPEPRGAATLEELAPGSGREARRERTDCTLRQPAGGPEAQTTVHSTSQPPLEPSHSTRRRASDDQLPTWRGKQRCICELGSWTEWLFSEQHSTRTGEQTWLPSRNPVGYRVYQRLLVSTPHRRTERGTPSYELTWERSHVRWLHDWGEWRHLRNQQDDCRF
jgi:hypothetical protein